MTCALPIHSIALTKPRGAFKPCTWCGGETGTAEVAPVIEPARHAARMKCESCGRQIAWMSPKQVRRAMRQSEAA